MAVHHGTPIAHATLDALPPPLQSARSRSASLLRLGAVTVAPPGSLGEYVRPEHVAAEVRLHRVHGGSVLSLHLFELSPQPSFQNPTRVY